MQPEGLDLAVRVLWRLTRRALWAPACVFLLHVFLSRVTETYRDLPWLDKPMHLAGGAAIAYCFHCGLGLMEEDGILEAMGARVRWLLAASLTCSATVLWEFAEYTTDSFGWTRAQAGLEDTLGDMALGLLGGSLCLCWMWLGASNPR